jgi:tRNA pseudouridine55 synthase
MHRNETLMDGAIVVDKPEGWTSHDVVAKLRRLANTKKVGHLGTLDPMATGVLPLLLGRATRLAQFCNRQQKTYEGVIRFGFATDTYDREGTPTSPDSAPVLDPAVLDEHLHQFRGKFLQTPPPVSAKKVGGVPAYKLARKNQPVELTPVEVEVFELTVLEVQGSTLRLRVRCSAGTYLRAIAHDLGCLLGCGAHLAALRRTAAGDFSIDQAQTLEQLGVMAGEGRLGDALIPAAQLIPEFAAEFVDDLTEGQIRQGRDFFVSPFRVQKGTPYVKAVTRDGRLVAIGECKLPNVYHPLLVL